MRRVSIELSIQRDPCGKRGWLRFSDDTLSATRNRAAFMGEAGVVATYALTKRLALRATAEAIWIEGVALAPEQIGASSFGAVAPGSAFVDTSGGVFYYGCGLGIEYRF